MATSMDSPLVLSTPDENILGCTSLEVLKARSIPLSDERLRLTYEIERTVREIRHGGWRRIALQFPDAMLIDAPRVFEALQNDLRDGASTCRDSPGLAAHISTSEFCGQLVTPVGSLAKLSMTTREEVERVYKLAILGDTSYGACCVDEVAAEHVDAEVVVHYGRSCLSPTARLPVIYVFTTKEIDEGAVVEAFKKSFTDLKARVILMADVTFMDHISSIFKTLQESGYSNAYPASVIHSPSSPLPNRTVPEKVSSGEEQLTEYHLFHISEPPTSLLLTLSSRLASLYVYPTSIPRSVSDPHSLKTSTALALRRRYALITSLSSVAIFGILINTLSVKDYLHIVEHVKRQIASAGKKSYTFVVGKINAAKIANFSEVGGWVVIGCWESSLVESDDFWKPVITPFELTLALQKDSERVWTGEWRSDFNAVFDDEDGAKVSITPVRHDGSEDENKLDRDVQDLDSEPESAPPDFDLRTGRYVANSRPMQVTASESTSRMTSTSPGQSNALTKRTTGDLARIGGQVSPGAEHLRSARTWRGLGSDFVVAYDETDRGDHSQEGSAVEQGRSGIARGYTVGGRNIRS